jgi:acetyl esterase/lipase
MKRRLLYVAMLGALAGCSDRPSPDRMAERLNSGPAAAPSPPPVKEAAPEPTEGRPGPALALAEARRGFVTKLARRGRAGPAAQPPAGLFRVVRYDAAPGPMVAYLSPEPADRARHPAIIWLTGGDCNSIDRGCWDENAPPFDQSASDYRKAGIIMMFPALRGGNDNPGAREGYYGEVDDVLAAARFLRQQPYVDPYRIYLGGHSTGGTLALLIAESFPDFRAIFAFGPVADPSHYEAAYNPFGRSDPSGYDPKEVELRAPVRWLDAIRSPTFVIDGTHGNLADLKELQSATKNQKLHFLVVEGTDHFRLLPSANRLIAERILRDTGPTCELSFTAGELAGTPMP